jgi:hypothetical protein
MVPLCRSSAPEAGILHVRRQKVDSNLGDDVEKALKKKLPKLVNTPADNRPVTLRDTKEITERDIEGLGKYRAYGTAVRNEQDGFSEVAGNDGVRGALHPRRHFVERFTSGEARGAWIAHPYGPSRRLRRQTQVPGAAQARELFGLRP